MNKWRVPVFMVKTFLFLLEYLFKVAAGIVTVIVLGEEGSFFEKLGTGFGSFVDAISDILAWPDQISYITAVVNDYNTLTASEFNRRYGGEAVSQVMGSLNEGVAYLQAVYHNIMNHPLTTILAALIAFISIYFCARVCRFIRQRGRGSYLTRKERELGHSVFRKTEDEEKYR